MLRLTNHNYFTFGAVDYVLPERSGYLHTIRGVEYYLTNNFWAHPDFQKKMQEQGIPMASLQDLRVWVEDIWDILTRRQELKETISYRVGQAVYVDFSSISRFRESMEGNGALALGSSSGDSSRSSSFYLIKEENEQESRPLFSKATYAGSKVWFEDSRSSTSREREHPSHLYSLLNYTWSPETKDFRAKSKESTLLYFGVELEVNTRLSCEELQRIVTDVEPKQEPFFYMKSDSSVSGVFDNNVELVTFPMSPSLQREEWGKFFDKIEKLIPDGNTVDDYFDSSPTLNNGLHIHLSSDAFIDSRRDFHRKKFLMIFNMQNPIHSGWMKRITRRPRLAQESTYYKTPSSIRGMKLGRGLKTNYETEDKYLMARKTNKGTLEVRAYQSLFNKAHVLGCIDLTECFFNYSRIMPYSSLNSTFNQRFTDYVFETKGHRYAKEHLKCA